MIHWPSGEKYPSPARGRPNVTCRMFARCFASCTAAVGSSARTWPASTSRNDISKSRVRRNMFDLWVESHKELSTPRQVRCQRVDFGFDRRIPFALADKQPVALTESNWIDHWAEIHDDVKSSHSFIGL